MTRDSELSIRRRRALGSAYRLFYDEPLQLVRGEGAWLWDADGRRYLDAYNNVPHVGHGHPRVVDAIARQAAALNTHTRYLHEGVVELAERLAEKLSGGLDTVMFACSGTEANDLALRIARSATGNQGVIVTGHAYHGHSIGVLPLSTEDVPPERRPGWVATIPAPERYRCPVPDEQATAWYLARLEEAIDTLDASGHGVAALVMDTVMSSEGVPTVPAGFLAAAAERVRAAGGLFLADEVQAGFGRTGRHFCGFQRHGARADLVTFGKPMGNGYPVSAVAARRGLLERFSREHHYFNTFAGSPVAAAAALAVLDVIEEEHLQAHAERAGRLVHARLAALAERFPCIGDVRGPGLFIGVDLVDNRRTREPAAGLAGRIVEGMRELGVLVGRTGPGGNVIKIRPPLVITDAQLDLLLDSLERTLARCASR